MNIKGLGVGVVAMMVAASLAMAAGDVQLTVAQKAPYGKYLTDSRGHALYLFSTDTPGRSSCTDACAKAWPPLTITGTSAEPAGGPGVNSDMIGTMQRSDGSLQVTYNGWPLYGFVQDKGPGQIHGQDKHGFGGEWYLMSPSGERVGGEQKASTEGAKKRY